MRSVPAAAGLFHTAEFGGDLRAVGDPAAARRCWLPVARYRSALRLRGDARAIGLVCPAKGGDPLAFGVLETSRLVWLQVTHARLGYGVGDARRGPDAL